MPHFAAVFGGDMSEREIEAIFQDLFQTAESLDDTPVPVTAKPIFDPFAPFIPGNYASVNEIITHESIPTGKDINQSYTAHLLEQYMENVPMFSPSSYVNNPSTRVVQGYGPCEHGNPTSLATPVYPPSPTTPVTPRASLPPNQHFPTRLNAEYHPSVVKRKGISYSKMSAKETSLLAACIETAERRKSPHKPRSSSSAKKTLNGRIPCPKGCGHVCKAEGDMKRHLQSKIHSKPQLPCPRHCGQLFTRADAVKRHYNNGSCSLA